MSTVEQTAVEERLDRAVLRAIWEGMPETHHWITNITVDFTGPDTAVGDAHVLTFVRTAGGRE
jgi:hypothetical protein